MLKRIFLFAGLFGFFGACAADATAFVKLCDEDRYEEAAKLLDGLDAANPDVGRRLGLMYYAGRGVARDEAKGLELLENAMLKGDAWAAVTLGKIALRAEKNLAKVAWYVFAAECCGEDAAEDAIAKLRDALGDRYPASVVIHVGRLQRELAAARKEAAAAAAAREAGEKKSAQAEEALKAAQAEQKKMSETLASLQAELEAAKAARDNLQAEQEKTRTVQTRLEADLEKAKAERDRLTADLEDAQAEKVQLSVDREDAQTETKKVSDELDGTKKACEALVAERDAVKAELDAVKSERDAVKSELDAVKAEMAALKKAHDEPRDKPVRADVAEKKPGDAAAEPKTPGLEDLGLPSDGKAAKDDNMVAVPRDEIYQKYNALVKKHNELVRRYNKLLAQSQGAEVPGRP